jgi:hypothetical protein
MNYYYILIAVFVGIGATILADLWNLFLRLSFNIQSLNFCLLGRWIMYMPKGKFWHHNIKEVPPKSFECVIGWLAHYIIGIVLTLLFIFIFTVDWIIRPNLFHALLYGICTVIFPLFILQPSLGLGFASSNTPKPAQARLKSIMTHIVFGVGLWLVAIALKSSLSEM